MIMTNLQIYNVAKSLLNNFTDSNQYLPIKINFFLHKNKMILLQLAQEIEDSRMQILQHYGIELDNNDYQIPSDKIQIANKELEDLFSLEQDVSIEKVKIDSLPEDISLTLGQMNSLMFMLE